MAKIGWIDFSQQDRRKVKRILSLIRPEGQLDELGIGRIRDGLANRLFPGVSTIQTRAKYFFIVPYILRDYAYLSHAERRKRPLVKYLEDEQEDVKERLKSKYAGQDNTGIIGITLSNESRIVRPPSEIYWVGISLFGCIRAQGLSLYFIKKKEEKKEKRYPLPLLTFRTTQKETLSGMNNFMLAYPSIYLASLYNPAYNLVDKRDLAEIKNRLKLKI